METLPVTLIVKAPNQQIEDQTIKCELSWTINKLKQHLSEVYPSKPVSSQYQSIRITTIRQLLSKLCNCVAFVAETRTKINLLWTITKRQCSTERCIAAVRGPGNSHTAFSLYTKTHEISEFDTTTTAATATTTTNQ